MLLRSLFGPPPLLTVEEKQLEKLSTELFGAAQAVMNLTRPQHRDIACMVVRLPELRKLMGQASLEELYALTNLFFQVVSEAADRRKGEVAGLFGDEVFIVFGRILTVEAPVEAALDSALEIRERIKEEARKLGFPTGGIEGVHLGVAAGTSLSGPLGSHQRRTYGSVGQAPLQAFDLSRSGPPDTILVPASMAGAVESLFEVMARESLGALEVKARRPGPPPELGPA